MILDVFKIPLQNLLSFFTYPSWILKEKLRQTQILIYHLNDDPDIQIPKISSNIGKYYKSFNDELFSSFENYLLLGKKLAEYEQMGYMIEPWFNLRFQSLINHMSIILEHLDYDDKEKIERFIIDFYRKGSRNNITLVGEPRKINIK